MKWHCIAAMTVLAALSLDVWGCKKENPDYTQKGPVKMSDLLKENDMAAIVTWSYANDAETDHALAYNTAPAQYERNDFPITLKSKGKLPGLKTTESAMIKVTSVYDRLTGATEAPDGVFISIDNSGDDYVRCGIRGFKWNRDYSFTLMWGEKEMKGVIATVDRNRDVIIMEMPEFVLTLGGGDSYNKATDTYTVPDYDFSEALFKEFVSAGIINADRKQPDFADVDAFVAKEGKLKASPKPGDSGLISFGDDHASAKITPSSKLKEALGNGSMLARHVTTYCGQEVRILLPLSVIYPDYDFLHLKFYTFNPTKENEFTTKLDFEGNDGSVEWWSQVFPSYFTTIGGDQYRISNRFALADYDASYINLVELAFNVVDGKDHIMDEAAIEAAGITVRFEYVDKGLGDQPLPAADVTSTYKTYKDLWVDKCVFYYRTNEKKYIPIRGVLSVHSGNADFEIPTRFDRPKPMEGHKDIVLDYSTFALVGWQPFLQPEVSDIEIVVDENKIYRVPLVKNLMDNRPNGVSFNVIKDGQWVVGNANASDKASSGTNGFISGRKSYQAYYITLSYDMGSDIPQQMKHLLSIQDYNGFPHLCFDYTSQIEFHARIDIPVTVTLKSPWAVLSCNYTVTIKGWTN